MNKENIDYGNPMNDMFVIYLSIQRDELSKKTVYTLIKTRPFTIVE